MATPAELGVCYYPEHWPEDQWAEDARAMVDIGLSWVRIGEFAWSRLEPKPDAFDWVWLDKAIDVLGGVGLKIVLGTPSATPPHWMVSRFPDMFAVTADGQKRGFGSRRHYSFSHQGYRNVSAKMARIMSERYGQNPYVKAWQVDNEYGCHDTILSYDACALERFRDWLFNKYGDIDSLNASWGNVFWSMEYPHFEAIALPNQTVTEPNPSHVMDFRRFASDEVVAWNKAQVDALRAHSNLPIIHNYMGRILKFDHFAVGADLEIASWDSYPLGFLEDRSDQDEAFKKAYARQGDPDFQAFHHDLYRSVGGMKSETPRWWVMEQQPGPVNWAPYNPAPLPGIVKLWSWEAIAHGAEVVSYFRWRQVPFAQEQMHAGVLAPDSSEMPVAQDIRRLAGILPELNEAGTAPAKIAIIFDYASSWAWDTQPQGKTFDYFRLVFDLYSQLRKRGHSIDILSPQTSDFGKRDYVFIPGLMAWNNALREAVGTFKGQIIIGPRTGSKTPDFQIPTSLPPDMDEIDITIRAVESLRPDMPVILKDGGHAQYWREFANTSHDVPLRFEDGWPALIQKNGLFYVTAWFDDAGFNRLFDIVGLDSEMLPEGVRCRDLGHFTFFMNYSQNTQTLGLKDRSFELMPADVLLVDRENNSVKKI